MATTSGERGTKSQQQDRRNAADRARSGGGSGNGGGSGARGTKSQQQDRANQAKSNAAAKGQVGAKGWDPGGAMLDAAARNSPISSGAMARGGTPIGGGTGANGNRPSGPFQTARYSKLTPKGQLPSTGVMAGIADLIDGVMAGDVYDKYGEPDLAPKDITPQDVDALGSNMGSTGAGQDRNGTAWLDQRRNPDKTNPRPLPEPKPTMTLDDYLAELQQNYINPNSRYYLEQRGLIDPSAPDGIPAEWAPYFQREFDRIKNTLPGDLIGPNAQEADVFNQLRNYFSDQFGKNALDAEELRRRNDFTTQLNQKGFRGQVENAFGDTADDSIIDSIINPQYQAAQDLLTNQQRRGTLTNTGYNYALKSLGEQRNAANTKLQGIGATQRATARGGVEDYLDSIYGKAGGYKLGEQFDPNSFDTEFGNRLTSSQGGLEGNIRNAAPSNLFDTGSVLSNAGTAQGQSSRGSLLDTLANRRSRTQSRGLGTTGAF